MTRTVTIKFADGQTHVYNNVPDAITPQQIQQRAANDFADRTLVNIDGGRKQTSETPAFEREAADILSLSPAEVIAGMSPVRFALGAASPVLGAAQLVAEGVGSKRVTEALQQLERMKQRGMAAQPNALMPEVLENFDIAGLSGTVLSPAVLGAMRIPAGQNVLARAGQGLAIGAGFGAATPVTSGGDFGQSKLAQIGTGALIGAAIPPAIDAARTTYRVGRNIIDPLLYGGAERSAGRIVADALGPKRAAVESALAKPSVLVAGSQPTAAEAAAAAGSPELSALQRIASAHKPSAYSDIAKAQEAARKAAIQSFGADEATLSAAVTARAQQAEQLYKQAFAQTIKADPTLAPIVTNPFVKDALPHAIKLAEAKGISAKNNLTEFLHYVKLGLDKELSKVGDTALSATEKHAVQDVKKALVQWMGTKNTAYDKARAAFEKASKPINEMQVGQLLESSLWKPLGAGERPGVFAGAMSEAARTIKKATGQQVVEKFDDILQPQNLAKVKAVLADLTRKAEMERMIPLGRAKAAEAAMPFGLPATGPLQQTYMIFKTVLGRVSKGINEKTLDLMADSLQLPRSTLDLLAKVPSAQQQQFIDLIISQRLGRGAIAAGAELSGEGMQQQ